MNIITEKVIFTAEEKQNSTQGKKARDEEVDAN